MNELKDEKPVKRTCFGSTIPQFAAEKDHISKELAQNLSL